MTLCAESVRLIAGRPATTPVITVVLLDIFASIVLPVMVKELTKVCPELRKVLKFPVTKISPVCPGISTGKLRAVGVALTTEAREERILNPVTVLPPSFLYFTLYTTASPKVNPVKGSKSAEILRSASPGRKVLVLEVLFAKLDSIPENPIFPLKKSWSPVRGIVPIVHVMI